MTEKDDDQEEVAGFFDPESKTIVIATEHDDE
jgi:hypothetical protein